VFGKDWPTMEQVGAIILDGDKNYRPITNWMVRTPIVDNLGCMVHGLGLVSSMLKVPRPTDGVGRRHNIGR
jgi:hypothetical protein